jgi:hypothetical protein
MAQRPLQAVQAICDFRPAPALLPEKWPALGHWIQLTAGRSGNGSANPAAQMWKTDQLRHNAAPKAAEQIAESEFCHG